MKYSHLLFDLDGTLFDYDRAESEALEKAFTQSGFSYQPHFLAEYRGINKQIWLDYEGGRISQEELKAERFRRLGKTLNINIEPEGFSAAYLGNLSQGRFLLDGALELLPELSRAGYRMYLITNGLADVQRSRLEGSEITGYFRDVFISGEIGSAKPAREIFEESFRQMGNPEKEKVLIIGDSLSSDIAGGASFGIDTCWINPGRVENPTDTTPTYTLAKVSELMSIPAIRKDFPPGKSDRKRD